MEVLTILGPTASGKTRLALKLASVLNGAVISADSRQVYRGMDIGTGKDLEEYGPLKPYLIDIREAGEDYHLAEFRRDFKAALADIARRGKLPILCGGTALYIQAALQGLPYSDIPVNPGLRVELEEKSREELLEMFRAHPSSYTARADTSTRKRLIRAIEIALYLREETARTPGEGRDSGKNEAEGIGVRQEESVPDALVIGIDLAREERRKRITDRLEQRLRAGLLDEVKALLDRGVSPGKLIFYGLEYKFTVLHLQGKMDYGEMKERLNAAIHQFAKRQMTFFRKLEKDGLKIHWIDGRGSPEAQCEEALTIIRAHSAGVA